MFNGSSPVLLADQLDERNRQQASAGGSGRRVPRARDQLELDRGRHYRGLGTPLLVAFPGQAHPYARAVGDGGITSHRFSTAPSVQALSFDVCRLHE